MPIKRLFPSCIQPAGLEIAAILAVPAGAADCESHWSPRFEDLGLDGIVMALTVFDDGNGQALYAGGAFLTAGGATVNKVAKLNGNEWLPLGSGLGPGNWMVWALAEYDDGDGPALYIAGDFTEAGGKTVNRIGKWDGTEWWPLGTGVNGTIRGALTVFDDGSGPALYAGGDFDVAGGVDVSCIAKWDGEQWSDVGGGVGGPIDTVRAFAIFDDGDGPALYIGGNFETADGLVVNSIAQWDGQTWSDVGGGIDAELINHRLVRGLAVHDDGLGSALYVTGQFTVAGGIPVAKIAKWDGSTWSALGEGFSSDPEILPTTGRRIVSFNAGLESALYACGQFTIAGGEVVNYIARWDGESWSSLQTGLNEAAYSMTVFDEGDGPALIAAGTFTTAGELDVLGIAKWEPKPPDAGCAGDIDCDAIVDVLDLIELLASFGPCEDCSADIDDNGVVDVLDLLELLAGWGPC